MDVFLARQAILNRSKCVYGYELLFRSDPSKNCFDGTNSSSATSQVIANTLFSAGMEGILDGKKAFINFDRNILLGGSISTLPPETVVVEILETVEPDDEVVAACARLCDRGYTIALDDFVDHPKFEPLIQRAHIIKVDLTITPRREQQRLVERYRKRGIRMLAEKLETPEEYGWARSIGFDYFQGYFFTRPEVIRGKQISTSKIACIKLLQEAQREELDFERLYKLIRDDVSFAYKLLRYTNSAFFAHRTEIRTIEHALMTLGEDGLRRWVAIAALAGLASDKPHELIAQSLLRAKFADGLGHLAGFPPAPSCFTMGLFSHLDALLDSTLEYALRQINLSPPVQGVLLGMAPSEDGMAAVYDLVRCYESGDWDTVIELANRLGVRVADIGTAYIESARWAAEAKSAGL